MALVMQNLLERLCADYLKIQDNCYVRLQKPETPTLLIFYHGQLSINPEHYRCSCSSNGLKKIYFLPRSFSADNFCHEAILSSTM